MMRRRDRKSQDLTMKKGGNNKRNLLMEVERASHLNTLNNKNNKVRPIIGSHSETLLTPALMSCRSTD